MMKKDFISIFKRQIIILVVMAGVIQAGNISPVTYFKTWGKVPRVIPSTDPSGICYAPNLNSLLIADSEINEHNVWDNTNVFEVNFAGTVLKDTLKNQHTQLSFQEPTGVCYNPVDGYYYFTNDVRQRLCQYGLSAGWFHKLQWWDLDFTGVGGPNVTDPEGITCNPNTGKLYIKNGTDVAGPGPLIAKIDLLIYNSLGQKIKHLFHGTKAAGTYRIEWNGRNEYGDAVQSGLISAHMDDGNVRKTARQMMLLR